MPRSAKAKVTATFSRRQGTSAPTHMVGAASISRSYAGVRQDVGRIPELVARELLETIKEGNNRAFFTIEAEKLAIQLVNAINAELRRVGYFIGAHLIGQPMDEGDDDTLITLEGRQAEDNIEIYWKNLSPRTIHKKTRHKRRFFLHTGALKNDIRSNVGRALVSMNQGMLEKKSTGEVSYGPVRIKPYYFDPADTRIYKIAEIEVNLFAQSRANRLASILGNDTFDGSTGQSDIDYLGAKMGLNRSSIDKLKGPTLHDMDRKVDRRRKSDVYRPLLEPAIAYFFTVRVPRAVRRVIARHSISEARGLH